MTIDEIKLRRDRLAGARQKVIECMKALKAARDEYAEQEANRAGVFYGKTKVKYKGEVMFVSGRDSFWGYGPFYKLAKTKKDGTMSKAASGLAVPLSDPTVISEETP